MSTKKQNVFILFLEFFLCLVLLFSSIIIRKEQRNTVETCATSGNYEPKSLTFTQLAAQIQQTFLPKDSE